MSTPELNSDGGFLTYKNADGNLTCVGYLMDFGGKGVYDAELGQLSVTPQAAKEHNRLLSRAQIDGLDNNCPVGKGGDFYLKVVTPNKATVTTWLGESVAEATVSGSYVLFTREGKRFSGRRRKDDDLVFFKRVS